jgi:hypothetical protein
MDKHDYTSINQRVDSEAQELSKTHGLDEKRVVKVLHKLAEINWYDPDYVIYSELEKAFNYLSPQDALELFEKEDLTRLATRVMLIEHLNDRTIPFYALDKLADLTKEFISHLHKNKEHLLRTGFPETTFEKSPWLNKHLNKLYYFKLPIFESFTLNDYKYKPWATLLFDDIKYSSTISRTPENREMNSKYEESEELVFNYKWAKKASYFDFAGRDTNQSDVITNLDLYERLRLHHLDISESITCEYGEADVISGFSDEDVVKLTDLREKVFNLKISVLEKLYDSAKSKSKYKLIDDCTKIIKAYLTVEDFNFLIKTDHFYTNMIYGERISYSNNSSSLIYNNAGLSDLLMVIGHFHKEIELSTMDEISKALNDLPERRLPTSYYEVIGERWQEDLDALLYYFAVLEERELEFWNEYKFRINKMFNRRTRFSQEHGTSVIDKKNVGLNEFLKVNVSDTSEVTIDRETFEAVLKELLKSGGEVAFKFPPSKNLSDQLPEYIFANMGKVWRIAYKGNQIFINDLIGLHYIKILLSKQHEAFNPGQLVSIIRKRLPNKTLYSDMSNDQLADEGLYKSHGSEGKIAEKKTEQDILRHLHELRKNKDEAENNNQLDLAVQYDKELEILENIVRKEYGQGFKRKMTNKDYKRMYDSMYANINRAIEEIKKLNHEIGMHLDSNIITGMETSYCPPEKIPWILEAKLLIKNN